MNKEGRFVGRAILPFVFGAFALAVMSAVVAHGAGMPKDKLTIITSKKGVPKSHNFDIEVAVTEAQQALGLMYRTHLGNRQGMLFPYGDGKVLTMWMRNTYISLDMIFINKDGTIHRIESGTEPMSEKLISSGKPVAAVLEVAAGVAAELGVMPGDKVVNATYFKPSKSRK